MEKAKVGIFEDDESTRTLARKIVEKYGHIVVAEASTIDGARSIIQGLEDSDLDVAIVDGNLSHQTISGEDGVEITKLLHEKNSDIVVIGSSGSSDIEGADYNIGKTGINPSVIADIIASI